MTVADSLVEGNPWPRWFSRVSTLLTSVVVYFFATGGTMNPREDFPTLGASRFFWAQASVIAHGRLSVLPDYLAGECFVVKGKCFGYFGLAPSILRLPLLPLLKSVNSGLATIAVSLAIGLAFWSALDLVRRILIHFKPGLARSRWLMGFFAVQLGIGSVVMFAANTMVYQEAIAWSVGFGMLTLNLAWRRSIERGWAPWWAIVSAGVMAANSRPTMVPLCLVLGLWLLIRVIRRGARLPYGIVGPTLLAILPAITVFGVWMLKFGELVPDLRLHEQVSGSPNWKDVLAKNGGVTAGPVFIPTALLAYLRPDGLEFTNTSPFVDLRFRGRDILHNRDVIGDAPMTFVPPLADGGAYAEATVSVTDVMPLSIASLASIVPLVRRRRSSRSAPLPNSPSNDLSALGALGLAAVAGIALTVTNVSITLRYLPDFYPLTVVALAAACVALPIGAFDRTRWRVILVVGAAWSTWVALGLVWRLAIGGI